MTSLYFAYGSNLDAAQMRERCPTARVEARATLYHHVLAFAGHSPRWQGPVATAFPVPGRQLQGLLYRLTPDDLAALDRAEGHPFVYERREKVVIDEHGRRRRAQVYFLPDEEELGPPPAGYLAVLERAYDELGFDRPSLDQAARTRVFVYGTLLEGEANHRLLATARFLREASTAPAFWLHDFGGFPAMVEHGGQAVLGEVYEVDAPTIGKLDRLEGHPHLYWRAPLVLPDRTLVQTYLMPRERVNGRAIIISGSWRTHQQERRRARASAVGR